MLNYRLGHYCMKKRFIGSGLFIMYLRKRQFVKYGCYLSYRAEIKGNLNLPHPIGIVIGDGCIIQNEVTIYQNSTLGQGKDAKYPTISPRAVIYAHSIVIGGIEIGENAVIGAGSFVNKSIAPNSVFKSK